MGPNNPGLWGPLLAGMASSTVAVTEPARLSRPLAQDNHTAAFQAETEALTQLLACASRSASEAAHPEGGPPPWCEHARGVAASVPSQKS